MRGGIALLGLPVLGLTPAAQAAGPPPSADLRMVYEHPEITKDNSGVTWHWALTNGGAGGAETVVATHRVSDGQQVVGISQPCAGQGNDVVCRFDAIKPGEKRTGWIRTKIAKPDASLRVNAEVTWREGQQAPPGPVVDAGAAPGWTSWGLSTTDASTGRAAGAGVPG
jgi:hypothetical protein